ncbi:MAG: hypothetical protein GX254_07245 [Clostridiales bacterium]|jgi:signal peptidase|nr:hypothetical protein [Clostridiales bacterium]
MSQKIVITTDEKHVWSLINEARRGNTVRMIGIGNSMLPLLKSGRDFIDLIAVNEDTPLDINDVILYKSHQGDYVLHRIYAVSKEGYYPNGDGNLGLEPLLTRDRIYLKAIGFIRDGKYISTNSKGYRIYSCIWTRLLPIRKYIFRWYSRLKKLLVIFKLKGAD